ncbi:TolB family protein [Salibacterium halotolerans]|uniref:WD40-like Beta Propeller Repeat n=1 Tax=Salibacterium halotolerans TaxID=1884432 RepID=A0A1I5X2T5_9BACI|nr:PD40 domain-containing protein [Salibacterium halotolerans]SFQ25997.1 WD40-like Beta Propeller Repeat [Salibacterium halotolerans]
MTLTFSIRMLSLLAGLLLAVSLVLSFAFDNDRFYSGMGSEAAIAPQDESIVFTYFVQGTTKLYRTSMDGGTAERVTSNTDMTETAPAFSPDGSKMLFIGKSTSDIQSLYTVTGGETNRVQPSGERLHFEDAVYAPDGQSIYAVAMPAEKWMNAGNGTSSGFDIYEINPADGSVTQVTEQNYYLMNDLSTSPGGDYLMFTVSSGREERVETVSLTEGSQTPAPFRQLPNGMYGASLSPDGEQIAYTAVADTSSNGNYQYDLFLLNQTDGQTRRLTSAATNVESPVFYHETNRLLYMEDTNWPQTTVDYHIRSMDLSNGNVTTLEPEVTGIQHHVLLGGAASFFMNDTVTGVLFLVFGLTVIFLLRRRKTAVYTPAVISALGSAAGYGLGYWDPWTYQYVNLAVGPAATALLVYTVIFWITGAASRRIPY